MSAIRKQTKVQGMERLVEEAAAGTACVLGGVTPWGSLDLLVPCRPFRLLPIHNTSKSSWVSVFLTTSLAAGALEYLEKVLCGSGWFHPRSSSVLKITL